MAFRLTNKSNAKEKPATAGRLSNEVAVLLHLDNLGDWTQRNINALKAEVRRTAVQLDSTMPSPQKSILFVRLVSPEDSPAEVGSWLLHARTAQLLACVARLSSFRTENARVSDGTKPDLCSAVNKPTLLIKGRHSAKPGTPFKLPPNWLALSATQSSDLDKLSVHHRSSVGPIGDAIAKYFGACALRAETPTRLCTEFSLDEQDLPPFLEFLFELHPTPMTELPYTTVILRDSAATGSDRASCGWMSVQNLYFIRAKPAAGNAAGTVTPTSLPSVPAHEGLLLLQDGSCQPSLRNWSVESRVAVDGGSQGEEILLLRRGECSSGKAAATGLDR